MKNNVISEVMLKQKQSNNPNNYFFFANVVSLLENENLFFHRTVICALQSY